MFGSLRFLLAVMVAVFHLAGPVELSGIRPFSYIGQYAVFGFYLVSGYLMTLVLNERYRFHFTRFWANRIIRLYPCYLITCAATCAVLAAWPDKAASFHEAYRGPVAAMDYLGNVTVWLFPFYEAQFRLVPPAWSIGVELVMYFALFAFVARRVEIAVVSLVAAGCYFIIAGVPSLAWDRYYSIPAAALPFSMGTMVCFARSAFRGALPCSLPIALGGLAIQCCLS